MQLTWRAAVGLNKPLTAKKLLAVAEELDATGKALRHPELHEAVGAICPSHEEGDLGNCFRDAKRKVVERVDLGGNLIAVQIEAAGIDNRERTAQWQLTEVKG